MKKYLYLAVVAVALNVSCKSAQPTSAAVKKNQAVKPVEAPQTTPAPTTPTETSTATVTTDNENSKIKQYKKTNTVNLTPEQKKQVAAMSEELYKTIDNSDNKKAD